MWRVVLVFLSGYQRELTYKRTDGSYSAFGNGDPEGNMWYVGCLVCFDISLQCPSQCLLTVMYRKDQTQPASHSFYKKNCAVPIGGTACKDCAY